MATQEIKKALKDAGLEVYQTRGDVVHLAERVRENLLMDAQISIRDISHSGGRPGAPADAPLRVAFMVKAQRSDFPGDGEDHLFVRARALAEAAVERGYREVAAEVRKVLDPGDGQRTLDTWCEVSFEKDAGDLNAAIDEARFALTLEKTAAPEQESVTMGETPKPPARPV